MHYIRNLTRKQYPDGSPVKPGYASRAVKKFLTRCGLEQIRLHDLRHTAATVLARRVTMKQVQTFLGHEDIQTTLGICTHVLGEDRRNTSDAMDSFLTEAGYHSVFAVKCSENRDEAAGNVVSLLPFLAKKRKNA